MLTHLVFTRWNVSLICRGNTCFFFYTNNFISKTEHINVRAFCNEFHILLRNIWWKTHNFPKGPILTPTIMILAEACPRWLFSSWKFELWLVLSATDCVGGFRNLGCSPGYQFIIILGHFRKITLMKIRNYKRESASREDKQFQYSPALLAFLDNLCFDPSPLRNKDLEMQTMCLAMMW